MSYRLTLLALGAALLAGCASPTAPARQGPAPTMEQLQGEWKQTGAGDKGILLRIDQQRLFAKAGCNGMFGPAAIDGGKLRAERLASTLMMCPPEAMQRDAKLSRQLEAGMDVSLDGERLKLSDGKDALTFERQPQGEIKFIYVAAERKACTGVAPMQCLQVRADKSKPWELHYGEIEGFRPEPGVAYRLRIKEVKVDNPPADASSIRWILDLVVEQEVVRKP
ncbi:META and DUF4377 domain-containing protein [Chromobacterium vaccinii]|uniref:META and DUF4377 domain-containing protein n=1 Tax=Chromobacterium vaccinii TaxID=1108595 RepID=UPI001E5A0077|nr:META and DUF4377 domain-containing protein [Chromobacterium vaccinii]MCD4501595.1 META and DUF4377 domain-containing protein [Chromobacterium vaccinii]